MSPQDLERKLADILNADVAGFSHLTRDEEEATIRTLTDYRREMLRWESSDGSALAESDQCGISESL